MIQDVGVDLGTSTVRVVVPGKGIVLREPNVVAVGVTDRKIVAIGERARESVGRSPSAMESVRPVTAGVVADFTNAQKVLEYILHRVCGANRFFKPRVLLAVPSGVTAVQRRAARQAAIAAGARIALLVEQPKAAALGAAMPIAAAGGNLVVDIGAGTVDVAVLSLNGIVVARSIPMGGDDMDEAIVRFVKTKYNLSIGDRTGEQIKITLGSAMPLPVETRMEVRGRDQHSGLPHTVELSSEEVRAVLHTFIQRIIDTVLLVLENTPPELSADLVERGIVMTGGASRLRGLDIVLAEMAGIPVRIADDPEECVAIGLGKMLEQSYDLREDIIVAPDALANAR